MEGHNIHSTIATIDNGSYGKREVRFETGRLAKQAAGAVAVYLDDDTMVFSATAGAVRLLPADR